MIARPSVLWEQASREADLTVDLPGGVPMFFRRIPAGSFLMGARGEYCDKEPILRVAIPDDFLLGTFVVTQEQYESVAQRSDALKARSRPSAFKGPGRPVETVSWREANTWCDSLTQWVCACGEILRGFERFCLPTEAEWEYACRAGTETEYYSGDGFAALASVAWFDGNSGRESHDVDGKWEKHPLGLYGMHGNVLEWCHDPHIATAYRSHVDGDPDPGSALRRGDWKEGLSRLVREGDYRFRVLRGGSWLHNAGGCRSASRLSWGPNVGDWFVGFRVCLVRGPRAETERSAEPQPATGVGGRGTRPETNGAGGDGAGGGERRGNREERSEVRGQRTEVGTRANGRFGCRALC